MINHLKSFTLKKKNHLKSLINHSAFKFVNTTCGSQNNKHSVLSGPKLWTSTHSCSHASQTYGILVWKKEK